MRTRASVGVLLATGALVAACAAVPTPPPVAPTAPSVSRSAAAGDASPSGGPASGPAGGPSGGPTGGPTGGPSARPSVSPGPSSATPRPTESAASRCRNVVTGLSLREQVGQLLMVAVPSTGLGERESRVLAATRAGSVLLLGNTAAGRAAVLRVVRQARAAAASPAGIEPLLAVDQEGGRVQRLQGPGFSRIPSAEVQAGESDDRLRRRARGWALDLDRAGIDADLAPVADVVPVELRRVNQPIGLLRRGYSAEPEVVAAKVTAFVGGMDSAGVATAVKHFPGLGRVRGNTDFTADVTDRTTRRDDPALAGFAAAVRADVDMVMLSSATYARIDPDHRATFSATVVQGMLRGDLDFDGVVVSDDLAATAMRDLSGAQRILRFVRAGGDLAIVGSPELAEEMASALVRQARDDPATARRIAASATRVVAMKARRGLADC